MEKMNWSLLGKIMNDEPLSDKEQKEVVAWDEVDVNRFVNNTKETLNETDLYLQLKKYNANLAWAKVQKQIHQTSNAKKVVFNWRKVAAAITILLATSIAVWQYNAADRWFDNMNTAKCHRNNTTVVLADGTSITLNNGSRLIYPKTFEASTRLVQLKGEAFFEVAPNRNQPFIVNTPDATVTVLGTSFNVNARQKNSTVEVIVKTGKVELASKPTDGGDSKEKVILLPGDKGVLNKKTAKLKKESTYNENKLAWVTHNIAFDETPLNEIVEIISDVYNVEISVDKEVDQTMSLTSTFTKQDIDYILSVVGTALNLQIEKIDQQYIIMTSKNK